MEPNGKTPSTTQHPSGSGGTGYNSGREESSAHAGQKILCDYGMDRSSVSMSREGERGRELAGSADDLSHSLTGVKAHQGEDSRGRKGTVDYPSKIG